MTRKFVLAAALIGLALILLPSAFFSNAGAYFRKSQSKQKPMERRLSSDRGSTSHRALQSRFAPAGVGLEVNSTGDAPDASPGNGTCDDGAGNCTLRAAIEEANALGGPDTISFNLPGPGVRTIAVTSPLPTITTPINIDGTSQPGFAGTPLILLTRFSPGVSGNGLNITANDCEVQGLIISGFAGAGIALQGGGGHFIHSNFIGTDSTGNSALGNGGGGAQIVNSINNVIGEPPTFVLTADATRPRSDFHPTAFTSDGNLISGNTGAGVSLTGSGATGNRVASNFIGTNAAGTAAVGNTGAGVLVNNAPENMIGGDAVARNLISGNNIGIDIQGSESSGISVLGNLIGTNAAGSAGIGNTLFGVRISGGSFNNIGGDPSLDEGNTIAFNGDDGVAIDSGPTNRILGNSIFSNGGLGIDLGTSGVTPNDSCDLDTGANNLQNFPVLTSAVISGPGITITGTLDSEAVLGYTIEFFSNSACDPSGNGEGRQFIGSINVATNNSCTVNLNAPFPSVPAGTSFVTATATSETGNTSEFSSCVAVTGGVNADLAISKNDSPDPVQAGGQVTYTILVTNNGPDPATNVVVTDVISSSAGYTFSSVMTSQGSCVTPPSGGTGNVTCTLGTMNSSATATISLIVNVTATAATTISNTTTVTSDTPDSNGSNNTATASTAVVTASSCVINCQTDVTVNSSNSRCGSIVTYPLPTTSGPCEDVDCTPASGSFFPVGTTTVTCTEGFATCSFLVTVIDNVAPRITCPENISTGLELGQRTKVVTYPLPVAIDNCSLFSNSCTPPSGATFPIGTTTVNCSASDIANNVSTCSFTVRVVDNQPPTITCPGNVVIQATAGQCATVVNYPTPNLSSGPTGTIIICSPPAASTFPPGTTTVTCSAITPAGLRTTCSFSVTVNGPPQATLTLNANKSALDFGPTEPVRKPKKKVSSSCDCTETFTIENTGCSVLGLDLASIMRTGSDVDSGRITDPDDSDFYTVTIVNPDGSERAAECNTGASPCITINPGQRLTFRVAFKPIIPAAFSGKTRGLAASEVVPDRITSKITFNQQGGSPLVINMVGRVSTAVRLIDPENPRKGKRVIFTRSGNELTVTYAIFDSNLDVNRARFEFFNNQGGQVGQPIDVDLAAPIRDGNIVKGQSFVVVQRFTGAQDNPEATSVRVTVFDAESSDTDTRSLASSNAAVGIASQALRRGVILFPPRSRINP